MPRRPNFKLRAIRLEEKLWTVDEAASIAAVSPQTIRRWEAGKQIPHLSSLRLLCKAYGKTPSELGF